MINFKIKASFGNYYNQLVIERMEAIIKSFSFIEKLIIINSKLANRKYYSYKKVCGQNTV